MAAPAQPPARPELPARAEREAAAAHDPARLAPVEKRAVPAPAPLFEREELEPESPSIAEPPRDDTIEVAIQPVEVHLRRPAGWRRVLAWAIDAPPFVALFLWGAKMVLDGLPSTRTLEAWGYLDVAAQEWSSLILPILAGVAILAVVYTTLCHALAGATLGKWALRLRVVGPGGRRPGLARSAIRSVLALLSAALLGLGVLLALFTRSGRGLHDLLARTWVVEAAP